MAHHRIYDNLPRYNVDTPMSHSPHIPDLELFLRSPSHDKYLEMHSLYPLSFLEFVVTIYIWLFGLGLTQHRIPLLHLLHI